MARAKQKPKPRKSKKSGHKNAARVKANNEVLKKYEA